MAVEARSRAAKCAARALAKIGDHGLIPHPRTYSVWYHYFDGGVPDLKAAVDRHLGSGDGLSEAAAEALYERFFAGAGEARSLSTLADALAGELRAALEAVRSAGRDAADYGSSLETVSGAMAAGLDADGLADLIGRAIAMTHAMVEHAHTVERRLGDSAATIDRLSEELDAAHRSAATDALTGLANRAAFDRRLQAGLERLDDGRGRLSLLLLDIDHFKSFNDTYGHQVGDEVLRLLGSVLRQHLKGQDTPARYGGEEFAVILPDTALAGAEQIAETLRAAIAKKALVDRSTGQKLGRITVSIGIAQAIAGESPENLVKRADTALYMAKDCGRNRVVTERSLRTAA